MADEGYITTDQADQAHARAPAVVAARGVDNEAPYFVDLVAGQMNELFPRVTAPTRRAWRSTRRST